MGNTVGARTAPSLGEDAGPMDEQAAVVFGERSQTTGSEIGESIARRSGGAEGLVVLCSNG